MCPRVPVLVAALAFVTPAAFADHGPVSTGQLEEIEVLGQRLAGTTAPTGTTQTAVARVDLENTRSFSLKDTLERTPGIFLKQGNGPRDVGISIRGSGARIGFGVRNVKIYEDGFPMTQSDGLSRTDLIDPHAYDRIEVVRGPSSARYDNYALGGAVLFHTPRGADVAGFDVGTDFGSFDYRNHYARAGGAVGAFEGAVFGSHVRSDGFLDHSGFETQTINLLASWAPDAARRLTLKYVDNFLDTDVPSRLSLEEIARDARDAGTTFVPRASGPGVRLDAEQLAQGRDDRRTVVGLRWDQLLNDRLRWHALGTYDVKDIVQTFGTITDARNPNVQIETGLTYAGTLLGLPATVSAAFFFNHMDQDLAEYFNLGDGNGTAGILRSRTDGYHRNSGGRLRAEFALASDWTGVLGVGLESAELEAVNRSRIAPGRYRRIDVDRTFFELAPEAALLYHPDPTLQLRARIATAYGVPGIGQLTATAPSGDPGNNTELDPQRTTGFDLGVDWSPLPSVALSLTGYYEFFRDELVAQVSSVTGRSFSANAPRSEHRGVEAAAQWQPWSGARLALAYTHNDHVYTRFVDTIGVGVQVDRDAAEIPGVERHLLNLRASYDVPAGMLAGFGGHLDAQWVDEFWINNANTLAMPSFTLVNLNLRYRREFGGHLRALLAYVEVQNLFDRKYIASANVQADLPTDIALTLRRKQAFFAGQERTVIAGLKLEF